MGKYDREIKVERNFDPKQWFDPSLLLAGNGSEDWSRWATKWLYANVAPEDEKSEDWSKHGVITSYDLKLAFDFPAGANVTQSGSFETNNRNWLLLCRAATAINSNGSNLSLSLFDVSMNVPPKTFLMEEQPVSNTFGSGEWPHVSYFPEEWSMNVLRSFEANKHASIVEAATLTLCCTFLQVRTI